MIECSTGITPPITLSSAQLFLVYTGAMGEARWLTPQEQAAWRSFMAGCRALFTAVDAQLQRAAGMPLAYYEILVRLSEAPGRALRMSQLAEAASASKSRASHAVARLEERGWVKRADGPTDRRGRVAVLTDEGYAVLAATGPRLVAQPVKRAGPVPRVPVLAQLLLRLHRRDRQLDPDDRPQLAVDEVRWRVADLPRRGPAGLVPRGQPADDLAQPFGVPVDGERPGEVHADVVPGRHDLAVPGRAGVPGRRHVRLRAVHDGQRHGVRRGGPPLRVRQRQVADQPPVSPVLGAVPDDRDQAGDGLGPVEGDQVGRAGGVHERLDRGPVTRGEMLRQVHNCEPMDSAPGHGTPLPGAEVLTSPRSSSSVN